MLQDLRFALRLLAKSPGFTAVAVVTLALAIGVNSTIFSLVDNVLLRSPVSTRPEEVVCLFTARRDAQRTFRQFSHREFMTLRGDHDVFTDVAAVNFDNVSLGRDEALRRGFAFMVSDNFFSLLGARPVAGRFFSPVETRPGAGERVTVASYQLWQREGGRPDFVGHAILINGRPHTVIGIAPPGFSGVSALIAPDLWLPLGLFGETTAAFGETRKSDDLADPRNHPLNLMGRLLPGFTIASARNRLPALAARLAAVQPPDAPGNRELVLAKPFGISPEPADPGPLRLMGGLLLGMAGVVLLIASLNLANLMLARASTRAGEMALRLALGATRGQLVRQILVEGLVLALAGGALGLLLSIWANSLLQDFFVTQLAALGFTLTADLTPDLAVVAATFLFCLAASLVFSVGPAWRAARADLVRDLKTRSGDDPTGKWNHLFSGRHLMVMGQVTLSLVLVFAAGLFVRTAVTAGGTGPATGFTTEGVVMTELDFSLANTSRPEALRRMLAAAERIRRLPGVQAAGLSSLVPYNSGIAIARVAPAGAAPPVDLGAGAHPPGMVGICSAITPGYLESIGVRILRGREFSETEAGSAGASPVCLVDEGLAEKLFPGADALGQRVRVVAGPGGAPVGEVEIVGVVSRHSHGMEDKGRPLAGIYLPLAQGFPSKVFLSARGFNPDPAVVLAMLGTFRRELRQLDPDLPVIRMLPFARLVEKDFTVSMVRLGAVIFGIFGGVALLLAVVGVYGVKAYAVACRTREIGIRMALGAGRGEIFALIMRQGVQQTAWSVGLGLGLAWLAGRALGAVFFQVRPWDPLALGGAALILSGATLLASYFPARRATAVSPLTALRAE